MSIESLSGLSGLLAFSSTELGPLTVSAGGDSALPGLNAAAQSGAVVDPFAQVLMQQLQQAGQSPLPEFPAASAKSIAPLLAQVQTALPALKQMAQQEGSQIPLASAGLDQEINAWLKQPLGLQEISESLGKKLPLVSKPDKEIDLNETMQTLADVLNRIAGALNEPSMQNSSVVTPERSLVSASGDTEDAFQKPSAGQGDPHVSVAAMLVPLLAGQRPEGTLNIDAAVDAETLAEDVPRNLLTLPGGRAPGLPASDQQKALDKQIEAAMKQLDAQPGAAGRALQAADHAAGFANTLSNASNVKSTVDQALATDQAFAPSEQSSDKALTLSPGDLQQWGRQLDMTSKAELPAMTKQLYSPEWSQELGSKILWMNNQNISSADLKLSPEHLGPISIRIDMRQEQTHISFTAQNAGVKEMLEASIPKLREMFGAQQLNLADVNVSQQSFAGQGHSQAQNFQQFANGRQQSGNHAELADTDNSSGTAGTQIAAEEIEQSHALVSDGLMSVYA